MKEVWKPIPKYKSYYSVSNLGRIRRDKKGSGTNLGHILKQSFNHIGYLHITLMKKGKRRTRRVSSIVAETFLGKKKKGYQINHIDTIKTNNNIKNLQYVTPSENIKHAWKNGCCTPHGPSKKRKD